MSGKSPRPDFGWTDYRFKINDDFGMLHETTLRDARMGIAFYGEMCYDYICNIYNRRPKI